jgi:hypothetical protein
MSSGCPPSTTCWITQSSSGVDGSSDRAIPPVAPSRTRAISPPSGATKAADARSDRSSSFASPRTLVMTWSISVEPLTAWLKRYSRSMFRCRSDSEA